jgi:hypothetical protein
VWRHIQKPYDTPDKASAPTTRTKVIAWIYKFRFNTPPQGYCSDVDSPRMQIAECAHISKAPRYSGFLLDCRSSILPFRIYIDLRSKPGDFLCWQAKSRILMYGFPTVKTEACFSPLCYCKESIANQTRQSKRKPLK